MENDQLFSSSNGRLPQYSCKLKTTSKIIVKIMQTKTIKIKTMVVASLRCHKKCLTFCSTACLNIVLSIRITLKPKNSQEKICLTNIWQKIKIGWTGVIYLLSTEKCAFQKLKQLILGAK